MGSHPQHFSSLHGQDTAQAWWRLSDRAETLLPFTIYIYIFPPPPTPQRHYMSLEDFMVSPPSCGQSVTNFWGWDVHQAQLRCPDGVDGDIWIMEYWEGT
jgi:hypothetical protein